VIDRNLRVAAKFALRKRLLAKSYKIIKQRRITGQNGRSQKAKHAEYQKAFYFKMWLKRYMLGDVGARYMQRRCIRIKQRTILGLQKNCLDNKALRVREYKFERIHIGYLCNEVLRKLSAYAAMHK
jgi:hypothetical protein